MVGTRPHPTETALDLGKGSQPGDEGLMGCLRDHPRRPITTATENREIGTGHPATEDPSVVWEEVAALAVEVILTPTSRATKESVWTGTSGIVVETAGHAADHRLPEENGTIGTADRITVGPAHLMMETKKCAYMLTNEIQKIWTKTAQITMLRCIGKIKTIGKSDLGIDIKPSAQTTFWTMAASVI